MTQPNLPIPEELASESSREEDSQDQSSQEQSFGAILSEFEQSHHSDGGSVEGTVVSVTPDGAFVDIGRKMDGVIAPEAAKDMKVGMKLLVSIRGRDNEGNYL